MSLFLLRKKKQIASTYWTQSEKRLAETGAPNSLSRCHLLFLFFFFFPLRDSPLRRGRRRRVKVRGGVPFNNCCVYIGKKKKRERESEFVFGLLLCSIDIDMGAKCCSSRENPTWASTGAIPIPSYYYPPFSLAETKTNNKKNRNLLKFTKTS